MKTKTKVAMAATAVTIVSLMINAYQTEPTISPTVPQVAPVSELVEVGEPYTPPAAIEPILADETAEISTQTVKIIELLPAEISQ